MKRKLGTILITATFAVTAAMLGGCKAQASMTAGGGTTPTSTPKPPDPPKPEPVKTVEPVKTADPPKPVDPPKAKIVADKDGKVPIPGNIVFESGKDVIKPESFPVLDQVKQYLDENPNVTQLRIEGHTDSDGDDAMNLKLSGARAAAVAAYLVGKGIPKERMLAVGFGETKPLVANDTPENKAQNRRVEFHNAMLNGVVPRGKKADGGAPLVIK